MRIFLTFIISLIATLGIEGICAFALAGVFYHRSEANCGKCVLLLLLVNLLTNPAAVCIHLLCARFLVGVHVLVWQIPIEVCVIGVEAAIYWKFSKLDGYALRHPVWMSVILNVVSYTFGEILNAYVW